MRALHVVVLTLALSACDRFFHVRTGTLVHHLGPTWGGQGWWVLLVFGLGALSLVLYAPRLTRRPIPTTWLALGGELVLFATIYAASGQIAPDWSAAFAFGLATLFIVRAAMWRQPRAAVVAGLLLAVIGPAQEALISWIGWFDYTHADILRVPWWLPPMYANGAFAWLRLGALQESRA